MDRRFCSPTAKPRPGASTKGKRLTSGRPSASTTSFKCNADGTDLVQLTDGPWDDFDPCFLPNGRIAFIS